MRIPLAFRLIAGIVCAVAYIWAFVLVIQGHLRMAFIIGAIGTGAGAITFAPMRESAY